MLEEIKLIDRIEVVEYGVVQVRESSTILKDGEQIAKTFHRWVLTPGMDISNQPSSVQAIANAAWTSEVVAEYEALREQQAS
jgi:hypothetical protein